ncbi:hypothetical protein PROFUN_00808 [Planoprotostelium fungivorum]|uniref:Uncharacterized protein n=1 Tax=Planoprotostelium fungivorum TaxID=1890364 RepID=A0A2P6P025_9EUKA|nr:hypothetical protein PROFUN_00808 [Planoprotostelium fungivorum]
MLPCRFVTLPRILAVFCEFHIVWGLRWRVSNGDKATRFITRSNRHGRDDNMQRTNNILKVSDGFMKLQQETEKLAFDLRAHSWCLGSEEQWHKDLFSFDESTNVPHHSKGHMNSD